MSQHATGPMYRPSHGGDTGIEPGTRRLLYFAGFGLIALNTADGTTATAGEAIVVPPELHRCFGGALSVMGGYEIYSGNWVSWLDGRADEKQPGRGHLLPLLREPE